MYGFEKSREDELREVWKKCGMLIFKKFEDYLAEVKKVERDLQDGTISMEKLKQQNDRILQRLQKRFAISE